MKRNLFKRVIACAATLAIAMQAGFVFPVSADSTMPDASYADGKLTFSSAIASDAVAVVATYANDGTLETVNTTAITSGSTEVEFAAADGAKIMVWDSVQGMKPMTKPVQLGKTYYSQDFEAVTDTTGWTSEFYADGMALATDNTNYFKYTNGTGKGPRSAYYPLPDAARETVDKKSVVEFDFKMSSGGTKGECNQVVIASRTGKPIGNGAYNANDYLVILTQSLSKTQIMVNEGLSTVISDTTVNLTEGYTSNTWAHAKAVLDFNTKTALVTITSVDGATTYFGPSMVNMGADATQVGEVFIMAERNTNVSCFDNLVVRSVEADDVTDTYHQVTFLVDGKTFPMSVKDGESLTELPDTTKTGYLFDGWALGEDTTNLLTNDQVLGTVFTSSVTYTAVYHKNPDYIEPMTSVEFSTFPSGNLAVLGADADTAADNIIAVKLTGELGTDLVEVPDSRVTDLKVDWKFDGFRHIVSKAQAGEDAATTDDPDSNEYCDYYAEVVEVDATSVNFKLRNMPFNFYGQVTATVTYNGQTMTITKPMAIVPNKAAASGVLLPKPGYVENFDWYSDDMVGYKATISGDNKGATDVVTGDWAAYGGNSGRGLYIASEKVGEETHKFLQINTTGTNSSSFAVNKIDSAPTGQVIISQDVRFHNANSAILFKQDNPVTWSDNATAISFNFTGNGFNLNGGEEITAATTGVWYKVVLSADVTSKLCYAKVYDAEGTLLGESEVMPFVNAGAAAPTYYCYRTPDNANGKLDFNNVKMYIPEIAGELTTTIENETLSVPENAGDEAATTLLTVSGKSTEGYDMIGAAEWTLVDEPENVTITPDATNSHNATLSVANGAQPGEVTVRVSLGGKTKDIVVTLSSSQDSVMFTEQTRSISIPLEEGKSDTYTYAAAVVDKNATPIEGKTVTYAMYDKNNVNILEDPTGITFDEATGVLTVTSEARATVLHIRATGTNSSDEVITRAVKVTVHGLAFDFGSDIAVAEGYTAVAAGTAYSESAGYGIEGSASQGGTEDAASADLDNLSGTFTFKAKVQPKKIYNVTINYSGNVASEYVNSDLTGYALENATQSAVTYAIPVIDDVLDLTFSNATVSSIVIEKQADKMAGAKPHVYTIGDSTIANNGSWAYVMNRDFSTYGDITNLVTFSNNGRGGKNLSSYYTGGEIKDRVLLNIKPGDYVMIGDMGTNGMGNNFEESFNYYVDACEAMGAKIILNSYSPHGATGNYTGCYDSATATFNGWRQDAYDVIVRAIYAERTDPTNEKYDENIVGFVDIGKMADAAFNAYAADYAANGYESADAAAKAIIACFSDHNHYKDLAAELMIKGYGDSEEAKGIVKALYEILSADLAE